MIETINFTCTVYKIVSNIVTHSNTFLEIYVRRKIYKVIGNWTERDTELHEYKRFGRRARKSIGRR